MNEWFMNPLFQMGAGILAANRPGIGAGQAIGQGMMAGMNQYAQLQAQNMRSEALRLQLDDLRETRERHARLREELSQAGKPSAYAMGEEELFPGEEAIPGLQTAGRSEADIIDQYLKEEEPLAWYKMQQTEAPDRTTIQENLIAAGYQEGTPAFRQAMERYLFRPVGTTVNVAGNQSAPQLPIAAGNAGGWMNKEKGEYWEQAPGQEPVVKRLSGAKVQEAGEAEKAGKSALIRDSLADLRNIVESGDTSAFDWEGMRTNAKSGSGLIANIVRSFDPQTATEAELSKLTGDVSLYVGQLISGAEIPASQRAQIEATLPMTGQGQEQFLRNLNNTLANVEMLESRVADLRARRGVAPAETQSESVLTYDPATDSFK